MAGQSRGGFFLGRILKGILSFIHVVFCFCVFYLLLLIFSIPLILLLCFRFILTIVFDVFYEKKLKLFQSENGIHAPDFYASVYTIYCTAFCEGPADIDFLRRRTYQIFTETRRKDGSRPYERMLCKVVKKFGFFCWENVRKEFDIEHHIRYFPGCSDPNKIYSEREVFEACGRIADKTWDPTRPRWEILMVPQMRKEDNGVVCCVGHIRIHHAYGDGVSVCQILRCCLGDQPPAKFIFDPVNPPFKIPLHLKMLMYLQVILMGPWVLMRFATHKERHVFYEGPLKGTKFMGRSTFPLKVSMMREIRKHYKCSTTAIQHYAMTGALQNIAKRRGLPVPREILGSIVTALVPYPDIYPQNRIMMFLEKFPVGGGDNLQRLQEINEICKRTWSPTSYYVALTSRALNRVTGILPAALIEKLVVLVELSYCISNVPGVAEASKFKGYPVRNIIPIGPLINGMKFLVGVVCYEDIFTFGFQTEKSQLIRNREEHLEFIGAFENEIKVLIDNMKTEKL